MQSSTKRADRAQPISTAQSSDGKIPDIQQE
jgi:hypothetical protein